MQPEPTPPSPTPILPPGLRPPLCVLACDAPGGEVRVQLTGEFLGYAPEEFPNFGALLAKIHPDDRDALAAAFSAGQPQPGGARRMRMQSQPGGWEELAYHCIVFAGAPTGGPGGRIGLLVAAAAQNADAASQPAAEPQRLQLLTSEAVARLISRFSANPDIDRLLEETCRAIAEMLDLPYAVAQLFDPEQDALLVRRVYAAPGMPRIPDFHIPIPRARLLELRKQPGSIVVIPDARQVSGMVAHEIESILDIRTIAVIPLEREGDLLGSITVVSLGAIKSFSAEALALLQTFAAGLVEGLTHARLDRQNQRQAQHMMALNRISRLALEADDLTQMLRLVAAELRGLLNADGCYISRWDAHRGVPIPTAGVGLEAGVFMNTQISPGQPSITRCILDAGRPIYLAPQQLEAEWANLLGDEGGFALLGLPLQAQGLNLGALALAYRPPRPEAGLLEDARWDEIAAQISLAMYKAVLLEQERRQSRQAQLLQQNLAKINSILDTPTLLETILDGLGQLAPYHAAWIGVEGQRSAAPLMIRRIGPDLGVADADLPNLPDSGKLKLIGLFQDRPIPWVLDDIQTFPGPGTGYPTVDAFPMLHSWMGLTLQKSGLDFASIFLLHREVAFYTEEHQFMAKVFAEQSLTAIENARLYGLSLQQANHIQRLNNISRLTLEATDLQNTLDILARQMTETLEAQGCYISLWDEALNLPRPAAGYGPLAAAFLEIEPRQGQPTISHSTHTGNRVIFVPDYAASPYFDPTQEFTHSRDSFFGLPLYVGEKRLGAVLLQYPQAQKDYPVSRPAEWEEIAAQISLAVYKAVLLDEETRQRQEAEALQRATEKVISRVGLEEVLNVILDELQPLTPFDAAAFTIFLNDELCRNILVRPAEIEPRLHAGPYPISEVIHWQYAGSETPIVVGDIQRAPGVRVAAVSRNPNLHAMLGAYLRSSSKNIGLLSLASAQAGVYTPRHGRIVQKFADLAAIAIENTRLFEQVHSGRERLQDLSLRLVEVQEAERRMIARELHDQIGQELTAMILTMDLSKQLQGPALVSMLAEAQGMANQMMDDLRDLSLRLRPSTLDDLGLLPALDGLIDRFSAQTGIQVSFHAAGIERRFSANIETTAFRIVQEALTNIGRYAEVRAAEVRVEYSAGRLDVSVRDRGKGFDPQILADRERAFGVNGMQERVNLVGGDFRIETGLGQGVLISAALPVDHPIERRHYER